MLRLYAVLSSRISPASSRAHCLRDIMDYRCSDDPRTLEALLCFDPYRTARPLLEGGLLLASTVLAETPSRSAPFLIVRRDVRLSLVKDILPPILRCRALVRQFVIVLQLPCCTIERKASRKSKRMWTKKRIGS